MPNIALDPRLQKDTHVLGDLGNSVLLLMNNALFPWFVLVPQTSETEFHKVEPALQLAMLNHINLIAQFIEAHHPVDKINIATIGNIVSQLHVHIVGRRKDDVCWPNVVWGIKQHQAYQEEKITQLQHDLLLFFQGQFRVNGGSNN